MPTLFREATMEQLMNTASQVVMAIVTVLTLWFAFRQQLRAQAKEREQRLTQLEANVENALHDQDLLTKQLHKENQNSISTMKGGLVDLKDMLLDKIHQIELSLAKAGINGSYRRKQNEDKG